MQTKRTQSKATARADVNYVRTIVDRHNCIFHELDLDNDVYIEFVRGEEAAECCIAVQIKPGASYVSLDGQHYILKADKDHFE